MKSQKKLAVLFRAVGFAAIVFIMVFFMTKVVRNHALSDTSANSFFNQEDNSLDVVYMGNCHAYTSYRPAVIEEITGMDGYVLATANQTAEMTYYYMCSALERQSPEYMVIEVFPFIIYDSYAANQEALDIYFASAYVDLPLRDRLSYLGQLRENGHSLQPLLFDLSYFHTRWRAILSLGRGQVSEDNGWLEWNEADETDRLDRPDDLLEVAQTENRLEIDKNYRTFLDEIIALAKQEEVQLIFVTVPYLEMSEEEAARYNTIFDIAEEHGIPYLNFTKTEMLNELNFHRKYMMDANHVDAEGARIISTYIGNYIRELEETAA